MTSFKLSPLYSPSLHRTSQAPVSNHSLWLAVPLETGSQATGQGWARSAVSNERPLPHCLSSRPAPSYTHRQQPAF